MRLLLYLLTILHGIIVSKRTQKLNRWIYVCRTSGCVLQLACATDLPRFACCLIFEVSCGVVPCDNYCADFPLHAWMRNDGRSPHVGMFVLPRRRRTPSRWRSGRPATSSPQRSRSVSSSRFSASSSCRTSARASPRWW